MTESSRYQPSHCNIGARQRTRRLAVAAVAAGLSLVYVLAVAVGVLPQQLLVAVFVPLSIAFEWGLQAVNRFCVGLALLGRYDFRGDGGGKAGTVPSPDDRRADRVEAVKTTAIAVVLAAATTGALTLVMG